VSKIAVTIVACVLGGSCKGETQNVEQYIEEQRPNLRVRIDALKKIGAEAKATSLDSKVATPASGDVVVCPVNGNGIVKGCNAIVVYADTLTASKPSMR
jgi:hypothetical protein